MPKTLTLRELFDKLTPGNLDSVVRVKVVRFIPDGIPGREHVKSTAIYVPLSLVAIEDDGSVTLVANLADLPK